MPRVAPMSRLPSSSRLPSAPLAALIVANALLAFGPLLVRLAAQGQGGVGPVSSAFWRLAIALPVLSVLAARSGTMRMGRGAVVAMVFAGVFFAADIASWHLGIVRTKLANATLFGNAASLVYPVYGFLVARMWPTRSQAAALVIAALGAALLLGRSAELSAANLIGDLLCITAGLFYAVYLVLIARARDGLAPLPLLALSTAAGVLPLLAIAWALGESIRPGDWTPLVALALGSQVFGQGLMVFALGRLSPLVVGLGLLTQPVVAATLGWSVFGERLSAADWIGAALIAVALVLVTLTPVPARATSA